MLLAIFTTADAQPEEQSMKIQFTQSGGFAGAVRGCTLDTSTLPPEETRTLEELVRNSTLSAGVHLSAAGRDLHQYDLRIENAGTTLQGTYDDSTLPPSVKPLVAHLK